MYQSVSCEEINGTQDITEEKLIKRQFIDLWVGSRDPTRKSWLPGEARNYYTSGAGAGAGAGE